MDADLTPEQLAAKLKDTETALQIAKNQADAAELSARNRSGWLGSANNIASGIAALAASVGLVVGHYNNIRLNQLEQRSKVEEPSYKFATEFLNRVGSRSGEDSRKESPNFRAILPVLDIIAQASSDLTGHSSADARAVLPLYMALILGEPGAAAGMDPDLKKLKWWLAMASVDDKDATRVTAVQALSGICRSALINQQLDVVFCGVKAMVQLVDLISDDDSLEAKNLRTKALNAKLMLARSLKNHPEWLKTAGLSKEPLVSDNLDYLRSVILESLPVADSTEQLRLAEKNLSAEVNALEDAPPATAPATEVIVDSKRTLATTQTVFATARKELFAGEMGVTTAAGDNSDPTSRKIEELLKLLSSPKPPERQKAGADLALLGQEAVKRLLSELKVRPNNNSEEDKTVRLGVATALSQMRQPITLDADDAASFVALLDFTDKEPRKAASDFLMDLWDGPSISYAFAELNKVFVPNAAKENTIYNAALIVGTWARNLKSGIHGPNATDPPMRDVALEKAKEWRNLLESSDRDRWKATIRLLNDLISRAEKQRLPAG